MDWLKEGFSFLLPLAESVPGLRAAMGVIVVFFLPGFAWTLVFFRQINILERVVLSVGLSIAMVVLSILVLNKLVGVKITGFNSLLIIIAVTVIPLASYYLNRLMRSR